jgi:hypothetical protein
VAPVQRSRGETHTQVHRAHEQRGVPGVHNQRKGGPSVCGTWRRRCCRGAPWRPPPSGAAPGAAPPAPEAPATSRIRKLSPSESHIFKTVSQKLCPSDRASQQTAAVSAKAHGEESCIIKYTSIRSVALAGVWSSPGCRATSS